MSEGEGRTKLRIERDSVDPATVAGLYLSLLKDQRDCDVYFIVGKGRDKIWAHQAILKARSSYFEARLSGRWANSLSAEENEVVLEDEEPGIFRSFLEHIYGYVFSASPVEAVELLRMAQYYGVPSLVKLCEELLAEPSQLLDLIEIFVLARKYRLPSGMSKAGKTMADYFAPLASLPPFVNADEATLIYLLDRNDLNVKESQLFRHLLRWADKQIEVSVEDPKPGRGDVLKNLIPLVRFPTMSAAEFAEVVVPTKILPLETTCNVMVYLALDDELKRNGASSKFPFITVPRKNKMVSVDFYEETPTPGIGTYSSVALIKSSTTRDDLTFTFLETSYAEVQIFSLVLVPPRYDEPLFQNSSTVAAMGLPVRVAITLLEVSSGAMIGEEVVANLGSQLMVLALDKSWTISLHKDKTYKISTRYLSAVYTVPHTADFENQGYNKNRDEDYDFFTSTNFRQDISIPFQGNPRISTCMSGSSAGVSVSSGLHLLRSLQVREV